MATNHDEPVFTNTEDTPPLTWQQFFELQRLAEAECEANPGNLQARALRNFCDEVVMRTRR